MQVQSHVDSPFEGKQFIQNFDILNTEIGNKILICGTNKKFKVTQYVSSINQYLLYLSTLLKQKALTVKLLNMAGYNSATIIIKSPEDGIAVVTVHFTSRQLFNSVSYDVSCSEQLLLDIIVNSMTSCVKDFLSEIKTSDVSWYFVDGKNNLDNISIPEILTETIHDCFYPSLATLGNSLFDVIDDYLNDKASVALLYGPPGTGKTTLIRTICSRATGGITYTNDSKVMNHSDFFMNFLTDNDQQIMVLEDIDVHLTSREEGNSFMYQLLGTSDGFIKNRKKKIIISSNVSDLQRVDTALLRDGRCWGKHKIDYVNHQQAIKILHTIGKSCSLPVKEQYSLSELFAAK